MRRRKEPEEKQEGQRATDGERAKLRGRVGRCDGGKSRKKNRKSDGVTEKKGGRKAGRSEGDGQ